MYHRLRDDHFDLVRVGVDEGLQQVDGRNADDGHRQFRLQHGRIHMRQPFRLVWVVIEVHARDKRFIAADDDHDQQIRDHDHIDQAQHHQHDGRFIELGRQGAARYGHGRQDVLQGRIIAEYGADQVRQFHPEMKYVHALGKDQAQVQRQLQPARHEDEGGQGMQFAMGGLL